MKRRNAAGYVVDLRAPFLKFFQASVYYSQRFFVPHFRLAEIIEAFHRLLETVLEHIEELDDRGIELDLARGVEAHDAHEKALYAAEPSVLRDRPGIVDLGGVVKLEIHLVAEMDIVKVRSFGRLVRRQRPNRFRPGIFQMKFHPAQKLLRFHLFHPHIKISIFRH